ncbi:hypothetical protein C2E21_6591 [Chlorella sorokiniana]|uniref:Uncharacterized protein n=1 Tax=Chlorella sorokiniana TaxID=3076 RepID=A0A2P6TK98_CHLSO|nr:hypothetical protein C2E21_6591 [Chlorella sorokiniana]|eukprot:PRW44513.1 hypothetical protein C2E21_6591 [Chlorella sorokiniana]
MDGGADRLAVALGRLSRASSLLGSPLQLFLLGLAVFALALSCLQALAAAEKKQQDVGADRIKAFWPKQQQVQLSELQFIRHVQQNP